MSDNLRWAVLVLLTFWLVCRPLAAQEKPPAPEAKNGKPASAQPRSPSADPGKDLEAIRRASREFVEAFNRQDAKAIAALWTEQGDYIDEAGRVYAGREAIEKEYELFFKENKGVKMEVVIDALRMLSPEAAIEDGRATLQPAPAGAPSISKYTAVHVKANGKWLMASVRDVRIETPSGYRNVEDLEFLIGTWTAEEHGAKTVSVCRWIANKSFVLRSYTVTHADHTTSSGVQIIGYSPQARQIQSWNFTSDGGHSVGLWTPREGGWQAEVRGVTGDGIATTAVNLLTRIDDNAYAWQSVQRTAGGAALPDTEEIVMKRAAAR